MGLGGNGKSTRFHGRQGSCTYHVIIVIADPAEVECGPIYIVTTQRAPFDGGSLKVA